MNTTTRPELEDALNRHTLALFLGADLPRDVTGLPSRVDLARDMARRHHLNESLSLAEVAQRVSQAGNRFEFTDFIRNALDTTGKSLSAFYQSVVALVKEHGIQTIITTAYDNLFEVAFQQASVGINRVVRGSDVSFIRPDRPTLIKLYGDAQQPDTLVVTDRDHSQLLRDRDKEDVIDAVRHAFKRNTILFHGYNLSDPDFKFLFDQIAESKFARLAYAVWPGLPEADVRMWRDRGIVILGEDPLGVLGQSSVMKTLVHTPTVVNMPPGSSAPAPVIIPASAWLDVEIRILTRRETLYPVELTLGSGEVFRGEVFRGEVFRGQLAGVTEPDGRALFTALVAGEVLKGWGVAHERSARRRLRLRIDPPELHALPWELLHDGRALLAAQADTPFSRYLPIDLPWGGAIGARPIRVLAVVSNPIDLQAKYDLPQADVPVEMAALRDAFAAMSQQVQLDFLAGSITLKRLEAKLRERYHLLHFVAHGAFNQKTQHAAVYLQNDDGTAQRVIDGDFTAMLARLSDKPALVTLATCQSAARSTSEAFCGLGPKLVQAGIPAVIAMQDFVTVATARQFSATLYEQLLKHGMIDRAANEARATLLTAGRNDAFVPVLFMRLKDGLLLDVASSAAAGASNVAPRVNISAASEPPRKDKLTISVSEQSEWNFETIRKLLTTAFSDPELTNLCFDHFPEVYETFSSNMSKPQKIQNLLEYCQRSLEVKRLLDLVQAQNPRQYARFDTWLRQ